MYQLWAGPSTIDQSPLVILANLTSTNRKTGPMVQTWILRADISPTLAQRQGLDRAICGDCALRNGACYVLPHQAPTRIWHGQWQPAPPQLLRQQVVRLGAYGDPVAVPFEAWAPWIQQARHVLGYTHLWREADTRFQPYLMASVESLHEAQLAHQAGWRTFRIVTDPQDRTRHEALCPAHERKLQCIHCQVCDGHQRRLRGHIVAPVHGANWKIKRFHTLHH